MTDATPAAPPPVGQVRDLLIEEEMKSSYLTYAMSVIMSRALPDVRDGLKPSQRRILVAMNDLNLNPRGRYTKCASIVGETMKKYHPHGDSAIYPTLVRLAQPFNTRYLLVDGQGNFGSVDGDPAAAMRYTEARMTAPATEMMADLDLETVDYQRNFDDSLNEPVVLPSRLPNLLVNGATGIAVGMATSMPPHNLGEVCDALVALTHDPELSVLELMEYIRGPDFPTGGILCGRAGIQRAYATGRSQVTVRCRHEIETHPNGRESIVITEIPYQVNKSVLLEKIADEVKEGRIAGIADVRDESDKDGMRIVLDLKRGEDANVVLNQLYMHTSLQDTFSIIALAIDRGRPRTLTLRDLLRAHIAHRKDVIVRRTRHLLTKAQARAHVIEGLRIAVGQIDEVIALLKASADPVEARGRLRERFGLSEIQAQAILDMRLQRLTGLEITKLEEEYAAVQEDIRNLNAILDSEARVLELIRAELAELKRKYADPRRTAIEEAAEEIDIEDLIQEETVAVTVSHAGYIKRMPLDAYRVQKRGGVGLKGSTTREGDFVERIFTASTHDYVLCFSSAGKVYWLKVYAVPALGRTAQGRAIVNLLGTPPGETITSMIPVRSFDEGYLILATERGVVKKTRLAAFGRPRPSGLLAILLDEGDRLIGVLRTDGDTEVILGTAGGQAIRFHESDVRAMGRAAHGVRGIQLAPGDRVIGMVPVSREEGAEILTICEGGRGKRTPFDRYRRTRRGGKGIRNIKTDRNGAVVSIQDVCPEDEVIVITANGLTIRTDVSGIGSKGRDTMGVRIIGLKENDRVVALAKISEDDQGADNGPGSGGERAVETGR
ncbi:MAG: DNA gyrase subunit A [Planctomycetes bacterium]|nr:DNA gyrase subunit A [Planctomycetota bacterium]